MDSPCVEFFKLLQQEKCKDLINYLQERNVLSNDILCACGRTMSKQKLESCVDGYVFRCSTCKKKKSIRTNSYFQNGHKLPLRKIIELFFHWICDIPVSTASQLAGVTRETGIQWYQYARDICSKKLLTINQQLGGGSNVVQIDETLMFRRKNNIGRVIEQNWIFGIYDSTLKKGYLEHVNDRSASSLIPIIQRWVVPGSIINSDAWSGYNQLSGLGFDHRIVNHSQNFVDPVTNTTTNNAESFWSRIKRRLKRISGSQGELKWAHLDEALYRDWFGFTADSTLNNWHIYLTHISEMNHSHTQ